MPDRVCLRSMAVELTARCNQKCTYCYNSWRDDGGAEMGELGTQELLALLDSLCEQAKLDYLTLTGGEPFTRKDIFTIIDHVNQKGLGVCLISNGGLISPEVAQKLAQRRIHYVQITLAGPDSESHDALAGPGSYRRIVAAFESLRAAGVRTGGSYLCTRQNYQRAGEVFDQFVALGVRHVAFNRFNPSGYSVSAIEALLPTRSMVVAALTEVDARAAAHGLKVTVTMPIPACVVDKYGFPSVRFGSCSAATEHAELALGPDGRVRLCTLQSSALGSLLSTPLAEILESPRIAAFRRAIPAFCQDCPLKSSCVGGCGAAAEWVLGSADELDPFIAQHVLPDFKQRLRQQLGADEPRRLPLVES